MLAIVRSCAINNQLRVCKHLSAMKLLHECNTNNFLCCTIA